MRRKPVTVYKLNGEPMTKEDFHQLYVKDQLSIPTIAYVLGADLAAIYDNIGVSRRVHDRFIYDEWKVMDQQLEDEFYARIEEERERFKDEQARKLWRIAQEIYGKPAPEPEYYMFKGKLKKDETLMKGYIRAVDAIFRGLRYDNKQDKKKVMKFRCVDLSAMRLHRGLDMMQFSQKSGIPYRHIVYYEKTKCVVIPDSVGNAYMRILDISKKELKHIRECLSGERLSMHEEEERIIPQSVRNYVFKRDGGKCTRCDRTTFLHFHHKRRFSEGGKHEARNIVLLCVGCHAGEHYGEKAFAMLKSRAEKLGVEVNVG